MPRLVYATIESADRSHSAHVGRGRFLDAIEKRAPQVLDELHGAPLEAYRKHRPWVGHNPKKGSFYIKREQVEGYNAVKASVTECLEKYHIATEWMIDAAIYSLQKWARDPETCWPRCRDRGHAPWRMYDLIGSSHLTEQDLTFRFKYLCPDPTVFPYQDRDEIRETIGKEILEAFKCELRAHLDRLAEVPEGFVRPPNKDDFRHFEWLVLYVVCGRKRSKIAEMYGGEGGLNETAISKAVHAAAKLIDLPVPDRRGERA